MKMVVTLIIASVLFAIINSSKILVVVPTPSISHQVVFRPLIQELINRDHDVTFITTDPFYPSGKSQNKLNQIDLHDLSYSFWKNLMIALEKKHQLGMLSVMTTVYSFTSEMFSDQLKDKSVQKLIRDKTVQFDLIIVETSTICALIFSHIFNAPVIYMSSFGAKPGFMEMIGAVTHPFLYPTPYHQRIYNLTIWEQINELYNHIMIDQMVKTQQLQDDSMLQSIFGINIPTLSELKNNVHMIFLNIHWIWIHSQPVPHNVGFTWGLHKPPEKKLPKDLETYLDSTKNGVIYVSFGTNVKPALIAADKLQILVKVLSQLPYDILWKWDKDELPGKSDNIKISKWVPQYDVLRHPNLKLFITQGGLQSTDEAISAGVPLIGIPMFSDQEYNTEKYTYFKIGIKLNFKYLTVEKLENTIRTILTDNSYKNNVIRLRTQLHDQAEPALENAICWIEYVLRHGGHHLRAPAVNMSWTEYYELELVLIILGGIIVFMTLVKLAIHSCIEYTQRSIRLKPFRK